MNKNGREGEGGLCLYAKSTNYYNTLLLQLPNCWSAWGLLGSEILFKHQTYIYTHVIRHLDRLLNIVVVDDIAGLDLEMMDGPEPKHRLLVTRPSRM